MNITDWVQYSSNNITEDNQKDIKTFRNIFLLHINTTPSLVAYPDHFFTKGGISETYDDSIVTEDEIKV